AVEGALDRRLFLQGPPARCPPAVACFGGHRHSGDDLLVAADAGPPGGGPARPGRGIHPGARARGPPPAPVAAVSWRGRVLGGGGDDRGGGAGRRRPGRRTAVSPTRPPVRRP